MKHKTILIVIPLIMLGAVAIMGAVEFLLTNISQSSLAALGVAFLAILLSIILVGIVCVIAEWLESF